MDAEGVEMTTHEWSIGERRKGKGKKMAKGE